MGLSISGFSWKKLGTVAVDTITGGLIGGPAGAAAGATAGAMSVTAPKPGSPPPLDLAPADAAASAENAMLRKRRGAAATRLFGNTPGALNQPYVAAATLLGQ